MGQCGHKQFLRSPKIINNPSYTPRTLELNKKYQNKDNNMVDVAGGFKAIKEAGLNVSDYVCPSPL